MTAVLAVARLWVVAVAAAVTDLTVGPVDVYLAFTLDGDIAGNNARGFLGGCGHGDALVALGANCP